MLTVQERWENVAEHAERRIGGIVEKCACFVNGSYGGFVVSEKDGAFQDKSRNVGQRGRLPGVLHQRWNSRRLCRIKLAGKEACRLAGSSGTLLEHCPHMGVRGSGGVGCCKGTAETREDFAM
jgi:hypothetical protein